MAQTKGISSNLTKGNRANRKVLNRYPNRDTWRKIDHFI